MNQSVNQSNQHYKVEITEIRWNMEACKWAQRLGKLGSHCPLDLFYSLDAWEESVDFASEF